MQVSGGPNFIDKMPQYLVFILDEGAKTLRLTEWLLSHRECPPRPSGVNTQEQSLRWSCCDAVVSSHTSFSGCINVRHHADRLLGLRRQFTFEIIASLLVSNLATQRSSAPHDWTHGEPHWEPDREPNFEPDPCLVRLTKVGELGQFLC